MASQVFSGNGNFSYTNNTGQNARVIINFMMRSNDIPSTNPTGVIFGFIRLNWAGVSIASFANVIGKNIAFLGSGVYTTRNLSGPSGELSPFVSASDYSTISTSTTATGPEGGHNMAGVNGIYKASVPSEFEPGTVVPNSSTLPNVYLNVARPLPTEILLSPNQTFSAVCGIYNILVIPEAG